MRGKMTSRAAQEERSNASKPPKTTLKRRVIKLEASSWTSRRVVDAAKGGIPEGFRGRFPRGVSGAVSPRRIRWTAGF